MRSDIIKLGDARAPHRSLLRATGLGDDDFKKPFIAICNSHVDIIPGHVHLDKVGQFVKQCVRQAGGTPFIFNTIGVDDGIAMGHEGMKYSLPSRELIADCVETMLRAHCFDGMICIPNCDKIVPGMLMGAMRCNIPTVFVSGGPMEAGKTAEGKTVDLIDVFVAAAAKQDGKITAADLLAMESAGCPTCGSCSGMFTANSMNCLCEALGMALPTNGTLLATSAERKKLFRRAAQRVVQMVLELEQKGEGHGLLPREIVTQDSIDNSMVLDMAMGGSTNTVLHILAIAREAGIEYDMQRDQRVEPPHAQHLQGIAEQQIPRRGRSQCGRRSHHPRRRRARPAGTLEARLPHRERPKPGQEHRGLRHPGQDGQVRGSDVGCGHRRRQSDQPGHVGVDVRRSRSATSRRTSWASIRSTASAKSITPTARRAGW